MIVNTSRRRKRRRPTMSGRFGASTVALEIGLLRLTLDMQRELEKKEERKEQEEQK